MSLHVPFNPLLLSVVWSWPESSRWNEWTVSGASIRVGYDCELASCQAGPPSVLPNDPGPLQLVELFKYCTLLVNRHNILKVSQSNIYAAKKTFYMIFKQPYHLFIFIFWSFCFVSESENLAYLPRSKYYDENIGRLKSRLSKAQKDFFLSVSCTTALHDNKLINLFGMLEAWKLIFHG